MHQPVTLGEGSPGKSESGRAPNRSGCLEKSQIAFSYRQLNNDLLVKVSVHMC